MQDSNFFLKNIGPTLGVLSFFSSAKVSNLLPKLSKKAKSFTAKQKQGIMQNCYPTILTGRMTPLDPITNVMKAPITRIIHLRGDLFLVGYAIGTIEMRDFSVMASSGEASKPIASFSAADLQAKINANLTVHDRFDSKFTYMRDFDCKNGDESRIVMLFDSGEIGFLNLKDHSFKSKALKHVEWIESQDD